MAPKSGLVLIRPIRDCFASFLSVKRVGSYKTQGRPHPKPEPWLELYLGLSRRKDRVLVGFKLLKSHLRLKTRHILNRKKTFKISVIFSKLSCIPLNILSHTQNYLAHIRHYLAHIRHYLAHIRHYLAHPSKYLEHPLNDLNSNINFNIH